MRSLFALIFAASGAAALVYEVTWTRLLSLQLGHGVAAASTVLSAFMGGLAIGAAAGGRSGRKLTPARALRVYALLEAAIAVLALLLPFGLRAVDPLLASAYADGRGGTTFVLLRLGASLLLVSLPAAAMGATFPVASRWFVQHASAAARDAGALYSANTIGAALGAVSTGFLLLPAIGLSGATWIGVALNAFAAAGAWHIATRASESRRDAAAAVAPATPSPPSTGARRARARAAHTAAPGSSPLARPAPLGRRGIAAVVLGISGFASLTLQVVWTRLLALILGPTTYAFSTMVAVFIAGLAAGAAIGSRLAPRVRQPVVGLVTCLLLSAALAAIAAALVDRGLLAVAAVVARPDATFATVLMRQALLALALLAPMTIAFGAAFPFAVAVATRSDDSVAEDLGAIYAVNTAGAIAGALLSGFLLIPWLGLHGSIRAVTIVCAAGGFAVLMLAGTTGRSRLAAGALAAAVLLLGIWLPQWDRLLLSSGAYKYAGALQGPDLEVALRAGRLLYYREGATGTVAVRHLTGATSLAIDGKVDASNAGDMLTQRLLAHVPLLLHPNPKRAAILGLGSGVTLGSALTHPLERADVLEISPEVVEASRFFDAENHQATADPRTRLIVGDGRTHLLLTDEKYDVIVSEPSNPWMAGIASLFTREFFQAARERLAPGGVLCQWAHTYDISTQDLQSIVATFLSVFPDGTLWLVGDGDVLLIGSPDPIEPRLAQVPQAWERPGVRADLASVGATSPFHVLSMFVGSGAGLAKWTNGAAVQTDNRGALEFSGPRSIFGQRSDNNPQRLRDLADSLPRPAVIEEARRAATAAVWRDRGWMLLRADAYRPAYDDFVRALTLDPRDSLALEGLLRAAAPLNGVSAARDVVARLASDPANAPAKLALARILASQGQYDEAVRIPLAMIQSGASTVAVIEQLASILSDLGDAERMAPVVARLRADAPGSEAAHYYSAALLFMQGRPDLALNEARAVLSKNPRHAKAQNIAGASLASLGQRDEARDAFQKSIAADPRDPATYTNLATLEMQSGNRDAALQYFAEALTVDPDSEAARQGLASLGVLRGGA